MSYALIASKTDKHNWVIEKCSVTVNLMQMSDTDPKFGLSYTAEWSGIKGGNISGGPIAVSGNESSIVHNDPKVTVIVSDYTDTGSTISLHVEITVDAGKPLGTKTVFNETLSGAYPLAGFDGLVASMQADMAKQPVAH